jgi:hypothetical protein
MGSTLLNVEAGRRGGAKRGLWLARRGWISGLRDFTSHLPQRSTFSLTSGGFDGIMASAHFHCRAAVMAAYQLPVKSLYTALASLMSVPERGGGGSAARRVVASSRCPLRDRQDSLRVLSAIA